MSHSTLDATAEAVADKLSIEQLAAEVDKQPLRSMVEWQKDKGAFTDDAFNIPIYEQPTAADGEAKVSFAAKVQSLNILLTADPFAAVPQSIKLQPRWVCWRKEVRDSKPTKVPICASDFTYAKSNDQTTWSDFNRAAEAFRDCRDAQICAGVGFMLGDGFAGVDLDDCFNSDHELKSWARPIVDRFAASYMEISPSGNGIKIILKGSIPKGRNKRFEDGAIEAYSRGRFFTITGRRYGAATEVAEMQTQLNELYREQFGADPTNPIEFETTETSATDADIIARIKLRDREAALWSGNFSAYGSQSEADLSLVGFIASQTDDREQIDRIFRQSALMREKWNRDDYRKRTIDRAMKSQVLKPSSVEPKLKSRRQVDLVWFDTIKAEAVEWLWHGRIPLGKVTLFAGEGGCNKSTVAYDLAARVSAGLNAPLSDTPMPHGKVLILCGDDNPQNDIRPRLDVMRADQSCVGMIDLRDSADGTPRPFDLANLCDLRDALDKDDAINFVIIDPISAFVGKRDANKHSDVYALIAPLNQLAAEYGVAVVIVAHTNKGGKGANDYRSRINGSGAWSDATRSGFMFVKDRSDDDRRYITHGKINAAKIGKGIAFRVVEVPHEIGSAIRIEWEAEVDMTADQALQQAADNDGAKLTEAVDFLGEYHGEVANNVLFADAERRGIKLDTLYRAKAKLKIVARRDGFGREAVYYWDCGATATEIDRKTADDERSF